MNGGAPVNPLTIGAELELIPLYADSLLPVPIRSHTTSCSADVMRKIATRKKWREIPGGIDAPSWELTTRARVSFEPGGQIEVSSATHPRATNLIAELHEVTSVISDEFDRHGICLFSHGVDPHNGIASVSLQLHRERYEKMTRYFESIGPSGIRMMRQTASIQINLQCGADPLARWSLLNRLAPILIAIFANSSKYAGGDSGNVSYRAHLWRTLDKSRTGVFIGANPIHEYCDFALGAGWMFNSSSDAEVEPFRTAIERGATAADWDAHLTTLFPEVRPKGFFEIRSPDMIDTRWLPAAIGIMAGICYDPASERLATDLLRNHDDVSLELAARLGVHDASIATIARNVCAIAIAGCTALGPEYFSADNLDNLREFVDRYPANAKCPADDS